MAALWPGSRASACVVYFFIESLAAPHNASRQLMALPPFFRSIRAKLLLIALLLLLIPLIGFRFVQQMEQLLREGQRQVLVSEPNYCQ